ncbi:hypothetical protein H2203_008040 [Taxawa tesnikishii (nom. ined.)]|nr:hypothetical protein H2203_008040 [Dothideales sp. JES 119]
MAAQFTLPVVATFTKLPPIVSYIFESTNISTVHPAIPGSQTAAASVSTGRANIFLLNIPTNITIPTPTPIPTPLVSVSAASSFTANPSTTLRLASSLSTTTTFSTSALTSSLSIIATLPTSSTIFSTPASSTSSRLIGSTTASAQASPASSPASSRIIAGATVGAAAGMILILTALLYFLHRRKQAQLVAAMQQRSVYPEVAWLYDPPIPPLGSARTSPPPGQATSGVAAAAAAAAAWRREEEEEDSLGRPRSPLLPIRDPSGEWQRRGTPSAPSPARRPSRCRTTKGRVFARPLTGIMEEGSRTLSSYYRLEPGPPDIQETPGRAL